MTGTEEIGVWRRVSALLDLGRPQEAQAEAGRALASTPEDAHLWRLMSYIQGSLGEHRQALDSARRAAALEPDSSAAQCTLGVALWNVQVLGQPAGWIRLSRLRRVGGVSEPALAAMRRSLSLDPHDAYTHVILAGMYLTLGKLDLAGTHYAAALELEPHNQDALLGLARLALRRRKPSQAEGHAREVLAQNPQSVRALELLARAQLRQRQPDQAFRSALAAVRLDPASAYAQMQFTALLNEYLPQPAAQTVIFASVAAGVRNAYHRTKLSPEVKAQLRQINQMGPPVGYRQTVRLVAVGLAFMAILLSVLLSVLPSETVRWVEVTLFGALYAGLALWIIWTVIRRRRSKS